MSNLILLCGIPGSGKSHFAHTYFDLKYAIVSSDAIREELAGSLRDAHEQQLRPWDEFYRRIEDHLRHDVDVIADATFLTRRHRDRARRVAEATNTKLHLVIFKNYDAAEMRNNARDEDTQVPAKVMYDMQAMLWDTLAEVVQERYDTLMKIEAYN